MWISEIRVDARCKYVWSSTIRLPSDQKEKHISITCVKGAWPSHPDTQSISSHLTHLFHIPPLALLDILETETISEKSECNLLSLSSSQAVLSHPLSSFLPLPQLFKATCRFSWLTFHLPIPLLLTPVPFNLNMTGLRSESKTSNSWLMNDPTVWDAQAWRK